MKNNIIGSLISLLGIGLMYFLWEEFLFLLGGFLLLLIGLIIIGFSPVD